MDTKQFLSTVLSDQGYYCVLGIRNNKTIQKFYDSLDTLINSAKLLDTKGFDTYFALSTFEKGTSRKAKNAKFVKALFLDIDCGEDKPYKNQVDAIRALKTFCKDVGVPKPTALVNSGRGVHVYWGLTEAQTRENWQPVAEKLKAACEENGLHADPVVTADIARILRVPNTHNFKSDPAKPVQILGDVGGLVELSDFNECLGDTVPKNLAMWGDISALKDTDDGLVDYTYSKKSFRKLLKRTHNGKGCQQIAHHINKPNDISYDAWLDLLSIVKYCDDTDNDMLHKVSKGYEGYNPEETEKIAASIDTPHTCERFEHNHSGGCRGCKFRGKIHTPIVIGKVIEEADEESNIVEVPVSNIFAATDSEEPPEVETHVIPTYPKPYFRGANGGVYLRTKDKDGDDDEKLIWEKDFYLVKRVMDPLKGPSFVFKLHTDRDGVREFIASSVELTSRDDFRKVMCKHGLHILYYQTEPLMQYTQAWVKHLQAIQDETKVRMQFGWTEKCNSFVIGDREIFADRIEHNAPSSGTQDFFPIFEKKGSLEEWKKIPEFYNRPGFEEHQMMFAISFGSPMMKFIPAINGGIYHMYSTGTGFGKTTGQLGGGSIWGKPKAFILGGDDTINSIWNRGAAYKDMPLYIDEFTNRDPRDISSFAYFVIGGQQKNRMSNTGQNAERWRGDEWNMIVGTTANISLVEKISNFRKSPQGENARIMEVQVEKKFHKTEDVHETLELNRLLEQNYGWAGDVVMQEALKQPDLYKKEAEDMMEALVKAAKLKPEHRVWTATFAAALGATKFAKEQCDLVQFDIAALFKWCVKQLKEMKEMANELGLDANRIIDEFYHEHAGQILRIRSTDTTKNGGDTMVLPDNKPVNAMVARHEYDVNKLYMLPKPFKEWCIRNNYNYRNVVAILAAELHGRRERIRFGKGTHMSLPPTWTLSVSWDEEARSDSLRSIAEAEAIANAGEEH